MLLRRIPNTAFTWLASRKICSGLQVCHTPSTSNPLSRIYSYGKVHSLGSLLVMFGSVPIFPLLAPTQRRAHNAPFSQLRSPRRTNNAPQTPHI